MTERIMMFRPTTEGNTVSIGANGTSARVALPATVPAETQCEIYNADDTDVVFVKFGDANVVAALPSGATQGARPIPPGHWVVADIPAGATYVAAITGGGNATIYFTVGQGS